MCARDIRLSMSEYPLAYQLALHRGWAINETLAQLQQDATPETISALASLEQATKNMDHWHRYLPVTSCPPLEGLADWYAADLAHPEDGPYWWPTSLSRHFHEVDVPIMHLGGWFDVFLGSTLRCFQSLRTQGKTKGCRLNQRLIIGPWIHGPYQMEEYTVGELDFGVQAAFDLFDYRLRWWVSVAINVTSMMSPTNVSMASSMQKNEMHPFLLLGRLLTAFCANLWGKWTHTVPNERKATWEFLSAKSSSSPRCRASRRHGWHCSTRLVRRT